MLNIIFFVSFTALGLAGIAFWRIAWLRLSQGIAVVDPKGQRDLVGSPFGFVDVLLVFFAWFGGQAVSLGIALMVLDVQPAELSSLSGGDQAMLMGIVATGQFVATLLAFGFLWFRYRCRLEAISVHPGFVGRDVLLGFVAFTMVIPIILLVQWALTWLIDYEHASLEMLSKEAGFFIFAVVWYSAGFVAPVCEELFFRGVVQAWLQRLGSGRWKSDQIIVGGWDGDQGEGLLGPTPIGDQYPMSADGRSSNDFNPYQSPGAVDGKPPTSSQTNQRSWITNSHWPIFVTALFFAMLHFGQGAAPIPLFLFAVALGYLFRKTGSILPCIILHMLLNLFSLFWFTLNTLFGEPEVEAIEGVVEMANVLDWGSVFGWLF